MTPEQLKLSILQSAFQGKFTGECLPNETADDLYQQIQSEKQRLISEKKIKKEKPLPEISADEIPFDIPDNWRWCYVGDLFLHNTGKAQNSSGSTNGTIRKFITTSNLYWGEFDFTKVKEMPFTDAEMERCTVKKGDLLLEFDMEAIQAAGYQVITPVVVCNADDYKDVIRTTGTQVVPGDVVMQLEK